MNETPLATTGIEVEERALSPWERGYLAGVFAAWGIRREDENEYRDAISLLMAKEQQVPVLKPYRPQLRVIVGGKPKGLPRGECRT
jgi:hypothetical protein